MFPRKYVTNYAWVSTAIGWGSTIYNSLRYAPSSLTSLFHYVVLPSYFAICPSLLATQLLPTRIITTDHEWSLVEMTEAKAAQTLCLGQLGV